jgi:hypothetical protein
MLVRLRNRAGDASEASFPCGQTPSTTEVVAGPYVVSFELRAVDGATLAAAADQTTAVADGEVTTLIPVTFALTARSNLALAFAAPSRTSNCKTKADGGAGMTGVSFSLVRDVGFCAAVTFSRRRGGIEVGTYKVDCGSPQTTSCIETDETLTVSDLAPAGYIIHLVGTVGSTRCWFLDGLIDVPPGSKVARTLNLHLSAVASPEC